MLTQKFITEKKLLIHKIILIRGTFVEPNDQEFLRALHKEKTRTQTGRADYITKKLAFVTVLIRLSSFNLGITIAEIYWLLYFILPVAICYDLYIMSADSRIKRIRTFLRRHPCSQAGDSLHKL